ncbi:hypothetical protein [Leclercia adecarboxylata]|uniref:hypothetical protein n=1 Tax=Leclercia adecarboxylata TaxID=83655 RepID=UPI00370B0839
MRFVIRDPKKGSPGSADRHSPPAGPETQHVPRYQLRFLPYVVFYGLFVSRRAAADNGDMFISPSWYTSGKFK